MAVSNLITAEIVRIICRSKANTGQITGDDPVSGPGMARKSRSFISIGGGGGNGADGLAGWQRGAAGCHPA
jgi:hypothetical protein